MTTRTHPELRARRRLHRRDHPEAGALAIAASMSLFVGFLIWDRSPHVEQLVFDNATEYRLDISLRGRGDSTEVPIAYVWSNSTDVALDFRDPGATWVLRFSNEFGESTEHSVSRADLERADWTYTITPEVVAFPHD